MKAWHFTDTHEPLIRVDLDEPRPAAGEVLIDVKAAGLCHTDVGVLEDEGWLSTLIRRPIVMGHEVAGEITAIGQGVEGWSVGDRVGICPTTSVGAPGFMYDGGFGEKMAVPAQTLVRIPDNVSFAQGAAGTDAGMTSHHAVIVNGQVGPGTKLGVIGLGGLGQIGARVAVLAGAEVYAAEINDKVWPIAREIGVKDVRKSIKDFEGIEFDTIVDFAGFGQTTADAIESVRVGGRVVQVGMGRLEATISTKWLILKSVTLVGSQGGTIEDIEGVYKHLASGQLDPEITKIDFEEIPDGLQRLEKGGVVGRLVAIY